MSEVNNDTTVLVTGASGFIALHCILQLLQLGYQVRGTVRSPAREAEVRQAFDGQVKADIRLQLLTADLGTDDGWEQAVSGCRYVLHVASPFPSYIPKDENELIVPAREGTLRVLRAASNAGVQRVVVTSSIAAVMAGHPHQAGRIYDESDWSMVENCEPYPKSKTIAERAAWEFVAALPASKAMELAVINPGGVLGPVLNKHYSTSGELVRKLMAREFPGTARIGFAMVDVRDVASAHIAAMTIAEAAGQRFCCATEHAWISDIAAILARHYGARGYRIPQRKLPDFLVRIVALFDPTVKTAVADLGRVRNISSSRIRDVLGWNPRSLEEMVVSMAESMIAHGIV